MKLNIHAVIEVEDKTNVPNESQLNDFIDFVFEQKGHEQFIEIFLQILKDGKAYHDLIVQLLTVSYEGPIQ